MAKRFIKEQLKKEGGVAGRGRNVPKNAVRVGSNYGAGQTGKKKQGGKKTRSEVVRKALGEF